MSNHSAIGTYQFSDIAIKSNSALHIPEINILFTCWKKPICKTIKIYCTKWQEMEKKLLYFIYSSYECILFVSAPKERKQKNTCDDNLFLQDIILHDDLIERIFCNNNFNFYRTFDFLYCYPHKLSFSFTDSRVVS